jgi:hypothetical protein
VTYTGALITYNTPTAVGVKGEVVGAKAATKVEFALETDLEKVWVDTRPYDAGTYSVRVTFEPDSSNYKTTTFEDSNVIVIKKFTTIIEFTYTEFDYGTVIDDARIISLIRFTKAQYDSSPPTPNYNIVINGIAKDEGVFKIIDSGKYSVQVTLVFDSNSNYTGDNIIGTITIKNILPEIEFVNGKMYETYYYTGVPVEAKSAWPVIQAGSPYASGKMEYQYRKHGEGDNAWSYEKPVDVGEYDVRASYIPRTTSNGGDNYSATSKVFLRNIEILQMIVYINVIQINDKTYDGFEASLLDIMTLFEDSNGASISLPSDAKIIGSLKIGYNSAVSAGSYPILIGDFNIISTNGIDNYEERLKTTPSGLPLTYTIDKRHIEYAYEYTNNIYDGKEKAVDCIIDKTNIVNGDELFPNIEYNGDRINYTSNGFNVVLLSITGTGSDNYTVESIGNIANFKIELAIITSGVTFDDVVRDYDGLFYEFELNCTLDDATVNYSTQNKFRDPGQYTLTATVVKTNYEDLVLSATLTINRVAMNITNHDLEVDGIDDLRYGNSMPRITVISADGTAVFKEGSMLIVGSNEYEWNFTPSDTNYLNSTGKILLNVKKAVTKIIPDTAKSPSSETIYVVSDNMNSMLKATSYKLLYTSANGDVYENEIPIKPGTYTVEVIYEGDEYNESATLTFTYTVKSPQNDYLKWIILAISLAIVISIFVIIISKRKRQN